MPSSIDPIERLVAVEEIRRLKARYFWAVDRKDWAGLATVFTDDAVFDMTAEMAHQGGRTSEASGEVIVIGGPAIAEFCASVVTDDVVSVHHGYMPVIDVTAPEAASGRWTMDDWVDFGDREMHGHGWYEEEYRRTGGEWRISRLDLRRTRTDWTER